MDEHKKILEDMLKDCYNNILDLGSGKTSMSLLLNKFKNSNITGICYPGDIRKLDKIREVCKGKYMLIEQDICIEVPNEKYDLVLCHLLFGEATKFGNTVNKMADNVFSIDSDKILVIDYLEDVDINFLKLISIAKKKGYEIIKKEIYNKEVKENYSKFVGKNYIGILFEKSKTNY
ncbi:MAG: hypothetical protein K0R72_178 [Clostridia bacterium]|jgi:SAM-dependent methyltransferase|nr:hypothetical protein [Clostridia bacterium]